MQQFLFRVLRLKKYTFSVKAALLIGMITDKKNIIPQLAMHKPVIFYLGCGTFKPQPHWIGVDMLNTAAAYIVGDVYEVMKALPDNCADEIHASHFFEHLPDIPALLIELSRIL